MVQQSRQNEAEDRKRKEMVEAKNNADSLVYQTEKALKELGDKVPSHEQQSIQNKIESLSEAIKSDQIDQIKRLSEELQNAFNALSQQMYAQQQPAEPQPGGNGNGRSQNQSPVDEGEVIEGEFH